MMKKRIAILALVLIAVNVFALLAVRLFDESLQNAYVRSLIAVCAFCIFWWATGVLQKKEKH